MKQYKVIKFTRTGLSRFEKKEIMMSEDMVRMSFPTWNGDVVHHVGRDIYHIEEMNEATNESR